MILPSTLTELREAVLSAPRVIAVGAETKPRLSAVEAAKISTRQLSGIVEYDPSEFTFTALAGTPVKEIIAALAEKGQYLPFDPMLVEAGSTIGGVVASGLSGPGRFRYGGVRDFILGVRFVDGLGRVLRLGGKVVKNAAGFDVPKFLVGSLGRFGVIGEVTFKVFPRRESVLTLQMPFSAEKVTQLANSRFEADAIDVLAGGETMLVRLAGPGKALEVLAKEIGGEIIDSAIWREICETPWGFKTDITPDQIGDFKAAHVSCGGNVAFSITQPPRGMTLRGDSPLWIGGRKRFAIEAAVKQALDPQNRFPKLSRTKPRPTLVYDCPFCGQGGLESVLVVSSSPVKAVVCSECDTVWLSPRKVGLSADGCVDTVLPLLGVEPRWVNLERLAQGIAWECLDPTYQTILDPDAALD